MHYLVGLGNPGEQYEKTRHNAGWIVLKYFVDSFRTDIPQVERTPHYSGWSSRGTLEGREIAVLFPDTFMNQSGGSVKKFVPEDSFENLILIYDDIDIPLGEMKISYGKSGGSHNGVASVTKAIKTKNFVHIRIGIAPRSFWSGKTYRPSGGNEMSAYVLGNFSTRELSVIEKVSEVAKEAIVRIVTEGYEVAMNMFNSGGK